MRRTNDNEKTRVDRALDLLKSNRITSFFIVVGIIIIAFASFSSSLKQLVDNIGIIKSGKKQPSEAEIEDWAKSVDTSKVIINHDSIISSSSTEYEKINISTRDIYTNFLSTLSKILKEYQTNQQNNLYISIPSLPENMFSTEAFNYRASIIFSQNASWSIFFQAETLDHLENNPTLQLHFMNGDGNTKGAVGIGTIEFIYDLKNKKIKTHTIGVAKEAYKLNTNDFTFNQFISGSPEIIKELILYQLSHI